LGDTHTINIKLKAESTLLQITFIYTTRMYIRYFFHLMFVLIFTNRYLRGSFEVKHD